MNYKHQLLEQFSFKLNNIFSEEEIEVNKNENGEQVQFNFFNNENYSEGLLIKGKHQKTKKVIFFIFDLDGFRLYKLINFNVKDEKINIKDHMDCGQIKVL